MNFEQIRSDDTIRTYISQADASMKALGYTEHSFAHVTMVAESVGYLLETLGYPARTVELGKIAGFLHDIGNLINRVDHSQSGALMAFRLLNDMKFPPDEIAMVITAIGNHDEGTGVPVSELAAALILADKSDVRRSRVRDKCDLAGDVHDRVNYSVTNAQLRIDEQKQVVTLSLEVDTQFSPVLEFFEIFTNRMKLCQKAANRLGLTFALTINNQRML